MSEAIILPQFPPDLSGYALTSHTHSLSSLGAAASSHSHSGYASSSHSHSGYATTSWVTANFAPKGSTGGGTTDPSTPSTGAGGMGTSSFSWPAATATSTIVQADYKGSGCVYKYGLFWRKPITIPSAISAMTISFTAGNWKTSVQNFMSKFATGFNSGDSVSYSIVLTTENTDYPSSPNIAGTFSGISFNGFTGQNLYWASDHEDGDSQWGYTGGPLPGSSSFTTSAASYTFPTSTIASIAGKTLYAAMHIRFTAIPTGSQYTKTASIQLLNTVNFTVRIT